MPLRITKTVNEGNSCQLTFQVTDYSGITGIPGGSMSTATYTLKDKKTGIVINSRQDADVKSSFDINGNFSYALTGADNVIVNDQFRKKEGDIEEHLFVLSVTASVNAQTISLVESITIQVVNVKSI